MGSKLKENKASTSYLQKSSANSVAFVVKQVKFNTMLKGHETLELAESGMFGQT
jgi:hypothetical protein